MPQRTFRQEQNWEWLERQTAPRIFPGENAPPPPNPNRDVNNNPIVARPQRRRTHWPWQIRAQTSHIFTDQESQRATSAPPLTSPRIRQSHRSQSASSRWPWQVRAQKSVILDLLTGNYSEEKTKKYRSYQWDQRQSTLVAAAVNHQVDSKSADPRPPKWPWQERAQQSIVFRAPDKENLPRPIKYVWDQRRSRFTVKVDPLPGGFQEGRSHYKENYPQWQPVHNSGLKPAGKACYTDDYEKPKYGKRRINHSRSEEESLGNKTVNWSRNINTSIPLPSTLPPPSPPEVKNQVDPNYNQLPLPARSTDDTANVKESSCFDLVPLGYRFSEMDITQADRRAAKSI